MIRAAGYRFASAGTAMTRSAASLTPTSPRVATLFRTDGATEHDDPGRRSAGGVPARKPIFERYGERPAQRQEADQPDQGERADRETPSGAGEPRARQHEADEPQQHDQVRGLGKEREQLGEDEEH